MLTMLYHCYVNKPSLFEVEHGFEEILAELNFNEKKKDAVPFVCCDIWTSQNSWKKIDIEEILIQK